MKRLLMVLALLALPEMTLLAQAHNGYTGVGTTLSYKLLPSPLKVGKEGEVRFLFVRENQTPILLSECNCAVLVYAGLPDPKVRPVKVGKLQMDKEGLFFKFTPPKEGMYTLVLDARPLKHDDFQVLKTYLPILVE